MIYFLKLAAGSVGAVFSFLQYRKHEKKENEFSRYWISQNVSCPQRGSLDTTEKFRNAKDTFVVKRGKIRFSGDVGSDDMIHWDDDKYDIHMKYFSTTPLSDVLFWRLNRTVLAKMKDSTELSESGMNFRTIRDGATEFATSAKLELALCGRGVPAISQREPTPENESVVPLVSEGNTTIIFDMDTQNSFLPHFEHDPKHVEWANERIEKGIIMNNDDVYVSGMIREDQDQICSLYVTCITQKERDMHDHVRDHVFGTSLNQRYGWAIFGSLCAAFVAYQAFTKLTDHPTLWGIKKRVLMGGIHKDPSTELAEYNRIVIW